MIEGSNQGCGGEGDHSEGYLVDVEDDQYAEEYRVDDMSDETFRGQSEVAQSDSDRSNDGRRSSTEDLELLMQSDLGIPTRDGKQGRFTTKERVEDLVLKTDEEPPRKKMKFMRGRGWGGIWKALWNVRLETCNSFHGTQL